MKYIKNIGLTTGDVNIPSLDASFNSISGSRRYSFSAETLLLLFFKTSIEDPGLLHDWSFVFIRHLFSCVWITISFLQILYGQFYNIHQPKFYFGWLGVRYYQIVILNTSSNYIEVPYKHHCKLYEYKYHSVTLLSCDISQNSNVLFARSSETNFS